MVARGRRVKEGSPVAATLDHERHRHNLEFLLEVLDRHRHRIVDQAVNGQGPASGVHLFGRQAVVSDEMPGCRSDRVVQQVRGRLGVERPIVQEREPVLADKKIRISEGGRDQPARHVRVVRDCQSEQPARSRAACANEESAPVQPRLSMEELSPCFFWMLCEEGVQAGSFVPFSRHVSSFFRPSDRAAPRARTCGRAFHHPVRRCAAVNAIPRPAAFSGTVRSRVPLLVKQFREIRCRMKRSETMIQLGSLPPFAETAQDLETD